jgi:hypothetical protein
MTIFDFLALSKEQQLQAIDVGIYLAKREDEEYEIKLYQLGSFYIESFHHKELIVFPMHRPFSSTELLLPYLDEITIDF